MSEIIRDGIWRPRHIRIPDDSVFADALKRHLYRRVSLETWLRLDLDPEESTDTEPPFGAAEAGRYMAEITEALEVAAEAYVFDIKRLRRRAQTMLSDLDETDLQRRIETRKELYMEKFETTDTAKLIELDEIPWDVFGAPRKRARFRWRAKRIITSS